MSVSEIRVSKVQHGWLAKLNGQPPDIAFLIPTICCGPRVPGNRRNSLVKRRWCFDGKNRRRSTTGQEKCDEIPHPILGKGFVELLRLLAAKPGPSRRLQRS